ncbi:MAG: PKD domain-containing protein [Flavobacteriales bacterium]|nr:PKD domain-containing protein [Flavobacteriales bacterium]MDW8432431.1 PKD domain-containing protein [Flavobacteriales bacterium]
MSAFLFIFKLNAHAQTIENKNSEPEKSKNEIIHLSHEEYDLLKRSGQLKPNATYLVGLPSGKPAVLTPDGFKIPDTKPAQQNGSPKNLNSYCFIEPVPASAYSTPPNFYQLDDGGFGPIPLPFSFCFYGTNYNSFYINTNGNITFTGVYATFTPVGFPNSTTQPMIAPFWADVDFGGFGPNNTSVCYYQVNATNAIVTWYNVGYYNEQHDKKNTFQVIITDGNDPVLPPGNNVGFRYKDMQWTTGAASCGSGVGTFCTYNGQNYFCGGSGGFCGAPAVVGANRNNGVDFVQFGRFDHPGTDYAGPFGLSGVDWLDYQTFNFNTCTSTGNTNVPPVIQASNICGDTLTLCVNDSTTFSIGFLSPEQGQVTSVTTTPVQGTGFTVLSNNPGNVANLTVKFVASAANVGTNVLQILATDNGSPAANTTYYLTVIVKNVVLNPVIQGSSTVCPGQTTALNVSGGPYNAYTWSPGNVNAPTLNAGPGSYTVTVDSAGCSFTSPPFTVSQVQANPVITGSPTVCTGGTTLLNVTGNYSSYSWQPGGQNTASINAGPGSYTVTVQTQGCSFTSPSFTVSEVVLNPQIQGPGTICPGQTATLSVSGGPYASYLWNNNATTATLNAGPGTYTVTVTQQGCSATSPAFTVNQITLNPQIQGNSILCSGQSQTLTVSGGPYSAYQWSPGNQTSSSLSITSGGNYTVTVVQSGCTATSPPFTVNLIQPNPVITGQNQVCEGGVSNLSVSGGPYDSYSWSPGGAATASIPAGPGSYTVQVSQQGCTATSPPFVITEVTLNPQIQGNTTVCSGQTTVLSVSGGPYSSYQWSNGASTASVNAGPGQYSVVVTLNQCADTAGPHVISEILLTPIIQGDSLLCPGATTTLTVSGGPYSSYEWSPGNATSATLSAGPGTYTVTVSQSGCQATSPVFQIIEDQLPVQITGNLSFCAGDSTQLSAQPATYAAYQWSTGSLTPFTFVSNPGLVTVTVTSVNGCQGQASAQVTELPASVSISGPTETCENTPVGLTATGPNIITYSWSNGATGPTLLWPGGPVSVNILTADGCTATASWDVTVFPLPVPAFGPLNYCGGVGVPFQDQSTVSQGSLTSWQWTFQNGTPSSSNTQNPVVLFPENSQNSVTLTVTTDKNCSASITETVGIYQGPQIQATADPVCFGQVVFLNETQPGSSALQTFLWDFGDGTQSHSSEAQIPHSYPEYNTTYYVTLVVTDANGCKDSLTFPVTTLNTVDLSSLPNILTPDGDGLNDVLKFPNNTEKCYDFVLTIHNRWGQKIFETNRIDAPWNPGFSVSPGVYFWVLTYRSPDGSMAQINGTVTITR